MLKTKNIWTDCEQTRTDLAVQAGKSEVKRGKAEFRDNVSRASNSVVSFSLKKRKKKGMEVRVTNTYADVTVIYNKRT